MGVEIGKLLSRAPRSRGRGVRRLILRLKITAKIAGNRSTAAAMAGQVSTGNAAASASMAGEGQEEDPAAAGTSHLVSFSPALAHGKEGHGFQSPAPMDVEIAGDVGAGGERIMQVISSSSLIIMFFNQYCLMMDDVHLYVEDDHDHDNHNISYIV